MHRRVLVTGMGVVSAAGTDLETFWRRLLAGQPRTRRSEHRSSGPAFDAALVDPAEENAAIDRAEAPALRRSDRFVRMAGLAVRAAMADAGLAAGGFAPERAGVVFGSGLGGLMFQEEQMWATIARGELRVHPHSVPRVSPTAALTEISLTHGLRGPGYVVSSACASSAHAIGQGLRLIESGAADVMVVGGTEAPITPFGHAAFARLGVLARAENDGTSVCRPFDRRRTGFVLGEGAAALILEEATHAAARGRIGYATLAGYGQSLGAYHPVHARPDGGDAAAAISAALTDAGHRPPEIDYVNAHGTGTQENDRAEAAALRTALGRHADEVPIASSKGVFGHTLGAAGALEAVVTCLAIARQQLPPSAGFAESDPACPLALLREAVARPVRAALSNSFGFGNVNVSLLFARVEEGPS